MMELIWKYMIRLTQTPRARINTTRPVMNFNLRLMLGIQGALFPNFIIALLNRKWPFHCIGSAETRTKPYDIFPQLDLIYHLLGHR
jgi:hypothetical protein